MPFQFADLLITVIHRRELDDFRPAPPIPWMPDRPTEIDELRAILEHALAQLAEGGGRPSRTELDDAFRLETGHTLGNDWVVRHGNRFFQVKRQSRYAPTKSQVNVGLALTPVVNDSHEPFDWLFLIDAKLLSCIALTNSRDSSVYCRHPRYVIIPFITWMYRGTHLRIPSLAFSGEFQAPSHRGVGLRA
jgi:hypothetical protein